MNIYEIPIQTLNTDDTTFGDYKGKLVLVMNTASE